MDPIEELARAFARLPGIGPRQGKRFVYHLLGAQPAERERFATLVRELGASVRQCPECQRFFTGGAPLGTCRACADASRDRALLMLVEKDQDLAAIERAGTWRGRYFVLGGTLTLSGKGAIRERELLALVERRLADGLAEIVLALSATTEGEHTADHVRLLLAPYRNRLTISALGRGLATGSELEYADAETLRAALAGRKEA
jgi:recombination protein RecR